MKWVNKLNLIPNGEIDKYTTRIVAKGFLQSPHNDFNEVYAPIARLETIRITVAIAAYKA